MTRCVLGEREPVALNPSVAAIVVFLFWVQLEASILLYGAEFTAAYARLRRDAAG